MFGLVKGNQGIFNGNPPLFAALAQCTGDGFASGAGHGSHFLVGEQQRKAEAASIEVFADLVGQFEEQSPQSGGDGLCQGDTAGILQGETVLLTDALDSTHLGFFMGTQKDEEPVALDGTELGGGKRFRRNLVNAMR